VLVSKELRPIAFLTALFLLTACEKDATELVVLVNTDFVVPAEMGIVRARISDPRGQEISASEFVLVAAPDPSDPTRFVVPFSFGVVPLDGDASRRVIVDVDGLSSGRDLLLTRRAVTGFLSERTLLLPMFLSRSCRDVICPEGQTCTEAGCVSNEIEPGSLQEILPGEELLDTSIARDSGMDSGPDTADTAIDVPGDVPGDVPVDTMDATSDTADAGTPLSCDTTRCTCPVGYCDVTCTAAGRCQIVCEDLGCTVDAQGTSFLDVECAAGATCVIDAQLVDNAQITCRDGSTCDIDCRDTPSCAVRCFGVMPSCLVQCEGSSDCQMPICGTGAPMMCPGNILVCGRPCPP
jgi:hypothetical protein